MYKKIKNLFLLSFALCSIHKSQAQSGKKSFFLPDKIGFIYNYGNEDNFLFDDTDYYYETNTYKLQLIYTLGSWKKLNFELAVQPQIQFLKHQLLNFWFVQPEYGADYLEKRAIYTKFKVMNLYAFELAFNIQKQLFKQLNIQLGIGAGVSIIDTETERLAKGFTFIENFSLGFNYQTSLKTSLYLGTNFGHVSNLDFKLPNDGYNILGIELGISYILK